VAHDLLIQDHKPKLERFDKQAQRVVCKAHRNPRARRNWTSPHLPMPSGFLTSNILVRITKQAYKRFRVTGKPLRIITET
jgi:hypothetical protein